MANDEVYHADNGNTSPLDTADAVRTAVSDLSQRVLALETKPAVAGVPDGGGDGDRLARLEAVLGAYFGSEFIAYDAAHKPAAASVTADADAASVANQGTTGNGNGGNGGAVN
jgi:hypothetical protein